MASNGLFATNPAGYLQFLLRRSQDFHVLADERLRLIVERGDIVSLLTLNRGGRAGRYPGLMEKNERARRQAPKSLRRHQLALPLLLGSARRFMFLGAAPGASFRFR